MIAVDASVLIAHLDPGDEHHEAATDFLLACLPGTLVVHPITLAEVLVGGVRAGRGAAMRDDLRAVGVTVADYDEDEALRLAELRVGSALTLPDCCVLDTALRRGASLATFDSALARAAMARRVKVLPKAST